jgi:CRP/FNR family cyclic AMP-dependent transcriptional regulator
MPKNDSFPLVEHRSCAMLSRLTVEHVPRDGSLGRVRKIRKDVDIWQAEDPGDRIYFLMRGEVAIFSGDPQARDILLQTVNAGEPFGELCFCAETGGVRNSVARTCTAVTVVEIEYDAFLRHIQTTDGVLAPLVFTLCQRLGECETRTQILAHRGAQERVGRLLLQLAAKLRRHGDKRQEKVTLRTSHVDLAKLAAMSRSHVTVTLGRFRRSHLVEYVRNRGLIVVNVPALTAYLESRDTSS